jgi:hypothetical protein
LFDQTCKSHIESAISPGQCGAIHWRGGDACGPRLLWEVIGLGHQDGMMMTYDDNDPRMMIFDDIDIDIYL